VLVGADDHGRFSFVAAPGHYKVVMTGHAPMADGRFIQPQPSAITIGAKRKLTRLVISIR